MAPQDFSPDTSTEVRDRAQELAERVKERKEEREEDLVELESPGERSDELEQFSEEIKNLRATLEDVEGRIDRLEETYETGNDEALQEIEERIEQVEKRESRLDRIEGRLEELAESQSTLKSRLKGIAKIEEPEDVGIESQIDSITQRIRELEESHTELQNEIVRWEEVVDYEDAEIEQRIAELDQELSTEIETLRQEMIDRMGEKYHEMDQVVAYLEDEIHNVKQDFLEDQMDMEDDIEALKENFKTVLNEFDIVQDSVLELSETVKKALRKR
jgi:chromosome segregation ATPase